MVVPTRTRDYTDSQQQRPGLKFKRSVTTLRGGTLGYAEIVAVKVEGHYLVLSTPWNCGGV